VGAIKIIVSGDDDQEFTIASADLCVVDLLVDIVERSECLPNDGNYKLYLPNEMLRSRPLAEILLPHVRDGRLVVQIRQQFIFGQ